MSLNLARVNAHFAHIKSAWVHSMDIRGDKNMFNIVY